MNIYQILQSKPHNLHYLNRYYKFIQSCINKNLFLDQKELGDTEKHHICPKAKDLFPEYINLSIFPWNKAILTTRQHFIAHWMLAKSYPESKVYVGYIRMMTSTSKKTALKFTSRQYEIARKRSSQEMSIWIKNYILEFGHPKGMLGKYQSDENKQNKVFSNIGENNGMFGKARPDLSLSNIDPFLKMQRGMSGSKTKILKNCVEFGFNTIEEATQYFSQSVNKIKTDSAYLFSIELKNLFLQDFPSRTLPNYKITTLIDYLGITRPKRKKAEKIVLDRRARR